jgi:hypothetical protein
VGLGRDSIRPACPVGCRDIQELLMVNGEAEMLAAYQQIQHSKFIISRGLP